MQVANVGQICGGTAACAWTITRAMPHCRHTVAFLSSITSETRHAFGHVPLLQWQHVTARDVADVNPDLVVLHNTAPERVSGPLPSFTLLYQHSAGRRAAADATVYCSEWLARQCRPTGTGAEQSVPVLLQPVPRPRRPEGVENRALRTNLVVGRLCTPVERKWPSELVPFYTRLSRRFPQIEWEFVGCPPQLVPALRQACGGRVRFHCPSWAARSFLWTWDVLLYHHPTLTESFGRVVAESMQAGCIPIVDARGGFCEQIVPGTGFLCRDGDDFEDALSTTARACERRTLSRAAMSHGDQLCGLQAFPARLRRLLQTLTQD
ncbi:Glycosyl transferases group 1 [Maioricimonas rarisocia]|uniref:Glycosyl transferases group 1 n=2 Tax=Maioricimonas rarisocia TaxID=2528026 RepID=A0A517ZEY2_9PLAN|nr:Glycosyl transferases group 1 [Maioricimonas rarisocia]